MKTCFKCKKSKPLNDFYPHPRMSDGRLGKCRECTKADVRAHYAATIEERHAYEVRRNATPARRARLASAHRAHNARNPEKARARNAVANALRDQRLERRPCEVCGAKAQAHHEDYSRPLDVRWLCFSHHRAAHGQVTTQ